MVKIVLEYYFLMHLFQLPVCVVSAFSYNLLFPDGLPPLQWKNDGTRGCHNFLKVIGFQIVFQGTPGIFQNLTWDFNEKISDGCPFLLSSKFLQHEAAKEY